MLFYRAQLEGPPAGVLSLSAGPVRVRSGPGGGAGRARVTLRYALSPSGRVCTHRGWLHTTLPAGTRLVLVGYQADGDALLLSLRPAGRSKGGPQRLTDRFPLSFRLPLWGGDGHVPGLTFRLQVRCRPVPGGLLISGRLSMGGNGPGTAGSTAVPFCRLLTAPADPGLSWRAYGAVVELSCRAEPEGTAAGEVAVAVLCLGRPPSGPPAPAQPPVATVREVAARVLRTAVEPAGEGRAIVRGAVEVEVDWADQLGYSRWTGREVPFSALVEVPGLLEGDRLEAVAEIDRLTRISDRLFLLLAVGVTALRPVHIRLDGQYYRVEQVLGQAVTTLEVAEPLFCRPALPRAPVLRRSAEALLPADPEIRPSLRVRLRGPVAAGQRWRSMASLTGGSAGRLRLPLSGPLPDGAQPALAGLEAVGPESISVMAWALSPDLDAWPIEPHPSGVEADSITHVELPGGLRALSSISLERGTPWEARLLAHLADGLRLIAVDLTMPDGDGAADWQPLDVTAVALSPESIRIDVHWKRIIG